jgi:hypothetical protein
VERFVILRFILLLCVQDFEADSPRPELCRYGVSIIRNVFIQGHLTGGKETTLMVRLLGHDAHLVSYGAMAKQPLSIPTSYFIFKNLTCHGFWLSQWYKTRSQEEREALMLDLVHLIKENKVEDLRCASTTSTECAFV